MANGLLCAQILSVVAFILSLAGWWLAWVSGLIATIILWVACCCGLPRLVWITVSVMAVIAAFGEILAVAGVVGGARFYCGNDTCGGPVGTIIIAVVALVSWLIVASVAWHQDEDSGKTSEDLPK
ncbi:unnamed protein product [Cylindrotheca closterium]|uniref:Uncharacterized protein n=1 Tax=Cylindrotheca closterium TaxID=2856 RepID=A0AAD2CK95_9STRA|nr:unnamed protein product [Cylindrotheca closterium]